MTGDHPHDDALSALLDGEATLDEAAHVEACTACSARIDEFRRAANVIGGPVAPVADEQRAAAIAAALGAQVVPLAARRRRPPPAWLAGAAALVVVALGLVSVLGDGGDEDDLRGSDAALEAPSAMDQPDAAIMLAPEPVDAGDLGAVDPDELEDRLTAALAPQDRSPGEQDDGFDGDAAPGGGMGAAPESSATAARAPCETPLRGSDAALGTLRLTGRATVDDRPTQLLVFEVPGREGPEDQELRLYVVAEGDCGTILHTLTFPEP